MKIRAVLALSLSTAALTAGDARGHIRLLAPDSWMTESALGDPQKVSPCGGENGGVPTGAVTRFQPGETITVRWQETIYHPGHYRIAFTDDRNTLVDPVVTVDANQVSVSATIQSPPVAPVLLDGLYVRTDPNGTGGTTFEQQVTLPNVTCAHCTLQLIQFMAGHGPPNYIYYHCADIELAAGPVDGGVLPGVDAALDLDAQPSPDAERADAPGVFPDAAQLPPPPDSGITLPFMDAAMPRADASPPAAATGLAADGRIGNTCTCTGARPAKPGALLLVALLLLLRPGRKR